MKDIGKDAGVVRTSYQLICPVCGKPAFRRENSRAGVAYMHLTKKGSMRHLIGKEEGRPSSAPSGHLPPRGKDKAAGKRKLDAGGKPPVHRSGKSGTPAPTPEERKRDTGGTSINGTGAPTNRRGAAKTG